MTSKRRLKEAFQLSPGGTFLFLWKTACDDETDEESMISKDE